MGQAMHHSILIYAQAHVDVRIKNSPKPWYYWAWAPFLFYFSTIRMRLKIFLTPGGSVLSILYVSLDAGVND